MIPRRSIDALRWQVDVSLDNYGIDCNLYIPTNLSTVEQVDVYSKPADYIYTHYEAKVFVNWNPNVHLLKAKGVFVENEIPILCWFPNFALDDTDITVPIDILKDSYMTLDLEYIPANFHKYDSFVMTEPLIKNMHDAAIVQSWKAVPRRV
jgi:hypothetical protein